MRCGSPGYAAPELLLDKGYDTAADIFSMGAILYVMLCGRSCFRGSGHNDILQKNRRAIVDYPDRVWSRISPHAKDFCSRLLEKDPKKRMTAVEALEHAWLNLPEDEMNDQALDLGAEIGEEQKQREAQAEASMSDAGGLVTVTPAMAGRDVRAGAPASPFPAIDIQSDNSVQQDINSRIWNRAKESTILKGIEIVKAVA